MNPAPRISSGSWYRSPVDRDTLARLNQRSDALGLLQTLGHLAVIAATATLAWWASLHAPWPLAVLAFFLHGTVYAFLLNAFHELCHASVFRTRWLNTFFLYFISFISSQNPVMFWASHQEHHKYTLHPPDDLEVVLPKEMSLKGFLRVAFVNPQGFVKHLRTLWRHSRGVVAGAWESALFPADDPARRAPLFAWARVLLVAHAGIAVVALALGAWQLPVLMTLAPFYGAALMLSCNETQHIGLQDNVSDYRLCVRTFHLNPVVRFLYWHMNYHIEHHMYAAVPCYRLGALHEAIKHDLPPTPRGILETWRQIAAILRRQKIEPGYQHVVALPTPARG